MAVYWHLDAYVCVYVVYVWRIHGCSMDINCVNSHMGLGRSSLEEARALADSALQNEKWESLIGITYSLVW